MFGAAAEGPAEKLRLPAVEPWLPAEKLHREFQAVGFYLSAHPLDGYRGTLEKMRVQNWAAFSAAVKKNASVGRLAGTVLSKQERRTRTGNKMGVIQLSDATGQFEAVLFSESLAQYRDLLEPGSAVIVEVAAEIRDEMVNLRIQKVKSLDEEAHKVQQEMRVFLRDAAPATALSARLDRGGEGQVSVVLIKEGGEAEVEIELPDRYRLSPQIAAAIRAVPGVVEVELV
jgi:DNA polymerase-3 subunit alpha